MYEAIPKVAGVNHRFVKVNDLSLHVAESGSGEPLILLHGWPQHWYMWRYQIPHLARHYTVICPDLRGLGWSDAPSNGYEKEQLADDIIALLDTLNLNRVRVMGHDWGAWIGFLICLRNPERVTRYLALNITHPFQSFDSRVFHLWRFWYQLVIASPMLGKWSVQKQSGIVSYLLKHWVCNKTWTDEEIAIYTHPFRDPARAQASVLLYRSFLLREFIPVINGRYRSSKLITPTLILLGQRDSVISPGLLKGYEPYCENLIIELVPNGSHCMAEDEPELVTRRALEFFSS